MNLVHIHDHFSDYTESCETFGNSYVHTNY